MLSAWLVRLSLLICALCVGALIDRELLEFEEPNLGGPPTLREMIHS